MNSRERVIAALNLQTPDRTPRVLYGEMIGYVPSVQSLLEEKCAPRTPREYFDMDLTGVDIVPTRLASGRFEEWYPDWRKKIPEGEAIPESPEGADMPPVDEWGVWFRSGRYYHFFHIESPLADVDDFARLKEYPWPDRDADYRFEGLKEEVVAIQDSGVAVGLFAGSIFEQTWYLRGMENLMMDMMAQPEVAHYLYERAAHYQKKVAVEAAAAGIDLLILGDDVAMQTGLIMSAEQWREFLGPRLKETIRAAKEKRPEMKVFYHSDGNIVPLIPDLIDAGVEVLNPLQPECLDPAAVKAEFGDRLAFFGSISVQKTMPFGSPDDVRREVSERIRTVGHNGGLVLAPAHVLEPEVPWENILAFFEAAGT